MRNLNVPRPSASMAVACTALLVALGGGAYAQTQLAKNSVGTKQLRKEAVTGVKVAPDAIVSSRIKDGQVKGRDIQPGGVARVNLAPNERTMWVAVKGDGVMMRQSGEIAAVTRTTTGRYTVSFSRDVALCAWVASTSNDNTNNLGYAEAHLSGTSPKDLEVTTAKPAGNGSVLFDSGFHLVVACGTATAPR